MSTSAFAPLPLRAPSSQLRSASIFFSGAQHVEASFGACVSVNNNDDDNDDVRFLRDGGMDANGPRLSVVVVLVFVISRSPKRLAYLTHPLSNQRRRSPAVTVAAVAADGTRR